MMRIQKMLALTICSGLLFTSCKKDKDPVIVIPASSGANVEFNGLVGTETGSTAGNSVYLDLSTNTMTAVRRSGWDLAFYSGAEFRVLLNNSTSAGAKVLAKNDLTTVGEADTVGLTLAVSQGAPLPSHFAYFDNLNGSITGTVIPEISATETSNNVVIINRGTGGGTAPRPWMKIRVLRNAGGYILQYAGITSTTFQTIQVPKDDAYHFKLVSFENGVLDNGQPEKEKWDLVWGYSVYQTDFGGMVPYNFSDLIAVNNLSNVQVKQKIYADAATANAAYTAFNKDSVNKSENAVASGRWTIADNWRFTQPPTPVGAYQNIFYIIKDANGNYYKFRALSMGSGTDGGTRGKPKFKYDLISN